MCFFCTFQLHLVLHSAAVLLCSVKVVPLRLYVVSVGLKKNAYDFNHFEINLNASAG